MGSNGVKMEKLFKLNKTSTFFHFDPHLTPISPIFGVKMIPNPKIKFSYVFLFPKAMYSQNFVQIRQLFHFDPHLTPI